MKFKKKPVTIEAITFDELVEHGRNNGANIVNGMPWSWQYNGQPITHENDDCYLIPTLEGTMKMGRDDMLITGVKGEIYPCKRDIFEATYNPVAPQELEDVGLRLSFGYALEALKAGKRVCRAGWNGKGMWLSMSCNGSREVAAENFWSPHNAQFARENGGTAKVLPSITMKTATGEILMGWLASQTDMLAEDWMIVPEPA